MANLNKRRNKLKLYSNWQYNINYEYKLQSKQRHLIKILKFKCRYTSTHDPFDFDLWFIKKEIINERDRCLKTLYTYMEMC